MIRTSCIVIYNLEYLMLLLLLLSLIQLNPRAQNYLEHEGNPASWPSIECKWVHGHHPWSAKEKTGNIKRWIEPISRFHRDSARLLGESCADKMGSVLKPLQTLKEYFSCHLVSLGTKLLGIPWYQIVGAPSMVSLDTKLLELPAQFPIGSPGILAPHSP